MTADLILFNANVITMDPAFPRARLVAIKNGRILSVAKRDLGCVFQHEETKIIDCKGKTIVPGFIDVHLHLQAFAESLTTVDLRDRNAVRSINHIKSRIREASEGLPPGVWIRGGGYDDFHIQEKRHPNRWDLDGATSLHPVKITHRSGHAHVLNSMALKLVGITRDTPDPPDGIIDRDIETGEPTGILYGMGDWLQREIPPIDENQLKEGIIRANEVLISSGITSFHDVSHRNDIRRWERFENWKKEGIIKPRIAMALGREGLQEIERMEQFKSTAGRTETVIRGIKILVEETTGTIRPSQKELNDIVSHINRRGHQAIIHAIEEGPLEAACNAIEYALREYPRKDHRHRIEHCSLCSPPLADRISSLGIVVVTHPAFIYYNGERYLRTVPEDRRRDLYPIRRFKEKGVPVAGSSDCPVVPPDPVVGIFSAVTRLSETGERVVSEETVDILSALQLYTSNAALAISEEGIKGMISPGRLADIVVLDRDPLLLSPEDIIKVGVDMTIIDGEIVWERN